MLTLEECQALALRHSSFARSVTIDFRKRARKLGVAWADLLGEAELALVEASLYWDPKDPADEAGFKPFVRQRVEWACGMLLRKHKRRMKAIRDLDALPAKPTKPPADYSGGLTLLPVFPPVYLEPQSACPHHGPIPAGSTICCMVCHETGVEDHPKLKRNPKTDPKPEPKPTSYVPPPEQQKRARLTQGLRRSKPNAA